MKNYFHINKFTKFPPKVLWTTIFSIIVCTLIMATKPPEDRLITQMVIPVSKNTFFNTADTKKKETLCPYDMLYHPPDYNPKASRSDRMEPQIIRKNIWDQEFPKGISSTTHMMYGRPKWPILDKPTKEYILTQVKNQNPHMRVYNILEWAVLLNDGRTLC